MKKLKIEKMTEIELKLLNDILWQVGYIDKKREEIKANIDKWKGRDIDQAIGKKQENAFVNIEILVDDYQEKIKKM